MAKTQLTLGADLEKWLLIWAYLRESNLQSWIKVVLRLRVNHHKEGLLSELDDRATSLGITRDELIEVILKQANYDFEALIKETEK